MIHTLTLNPAIDRILYLSRFDKNITNRIQKTVDTIGGKGTHVSINLKILGKENTAFGISHGKSGQKVMNTASRSVLNIMMTVPERQEQITLL